MNGIGLILAEAMTSTLMPAMLVGITTSGDDEMGLGSLNHWLIVLVVILLVFGTGKLRNIGSDLGNAVKGFKKAMNDDDQPAVTENKRIEASQDVEDETHRNK